VDPWRAAFVLDWIAQLNQLFTSLQVQVRFASSMVGTQNNKGTEVVQEGGAEVFRGASSVSRCYDYGTMCNRRNESCPSTRGKVFLKFLVALGAGSLFALAGCGEKPKPAENVAANVGAREFTEFSTKNLPA
jgi:hypothetical protein